MPVAHGVAFSGAMEIRPLAHGSCAFLAAALALSWGPGPCRAGDAPPNPAVTWDLGEVAAGAVARHSFPIAGGEPSFAGVSVSGADARVRWQASPDHAGAWLLLVEVCAPPSPGPFRGVISLDAASGGPLRIEFKGCCRGGDGETLQSASYRVDVGQAPSRAPAGELTPGRPDAAGFADSHAVVWGMAGVLLGALLVLGLRRSSPSAVSGPNRNTSGTGAPPP